MGFSRQEYWSGLPCQGIFLTQESDPSLSHLLHWYADPLPPAPHGKCLYTAPHEIINLVWNHHPPPPAKKNPPKPSKRTHTGALILMQKRLKAGGEGTTEVEMVGGHHWLNGYEFEQAPADSKGHGSLACCSLWSCNESDTTERLNKVCHTQPWEKPALISDNCTLSIFGKDKHHKQITISHGIKIRGDFKERIKEKCL